jgi:hypothetical protein
VATNVPSGILPFSIETGNGPYFAKSVAPVLVKVSEQFRAYPGAQDNKIHKASRVY